MQIQVYYLIGNLRQTVPLSRFLDDCVAQETDRDCLVTVTGRITEAVESRSPFDEGSQADVRAMVEAAFLDTLLHEFAHLTIGPGESEADTYALLRGLIGGTPSPAAYSTFAILAMADRYIESGGEGHGRAACRALIANDVVSSLLTLAGDAYFWAMEPSRYLERRSQSRGRRVVQLPIAGDTQGCPRGNTAQVLAVERDLQMLASLLDRLAPRGASAEALLAGAEAILALPISTDEGKILRYSVLSLRLRDIMRSDSGAAVGARELALLRRVLERPDISLMTSEDYGRLSGSAAIIAYNQTPPGADLLAMNETLRAALTRAIYYHPRGAFIELHLGNIAYMGGRCAEGRRHLSRMLELSDNRARDRVHVDFIFAEEDAFGCARATETLRAGRRAIHGWR